MRLMISSLIAFVAAGAGACGKQTLLDGNGHEAATLHAVERSYTRPAEEVWRAVVSATQELGLKVSRDNHDALGGELEARRATGDQVEIEARSTDMNTCRLVVYVKPGDRNMAEMIQDHIATKLGMGPVGKGSSAGNTVEGTYDAPLDVCVTAARKAADTLKIPMTRREVHDTWALLECRQTDAIPVDMRLERTRKDQTRVIFGAGSGKSDDMLNLARRLKAEFERSLP